MQKADLCRHPRRRSFLPGKAVSFILLFLVSITGLSAQYTTTACSGSSFSFTLPAAPPALQYTWTVASITPAGTVNATPQAAPQNAVSQTLTNTGNVSSTVQYNVAATDGTNFTLDVTVYPRPQLTNTPAAAVCSGTPFNFLTASSVGGTTVTWDRDPSVGISPVNNSGNGDISETMTNTGNPANATYRVHLTANGCTYTNNITVTVNPLPVLNSPLNAPDVCSGVTFNYIPTSPQSPGVTFAWTRASFANISNAPASGNNNPAEALINTSLASVPVSYVYTLTKTATGCSNTATVNVNVLPTPVLNSSTTAQICSGNTFSYVPTTALGGSTFIWARAASAGVSPNSSNGAGAINEVLTNTTTAPTTATYAFVVSNGGCNSTANVVVTINPNPVLSSSINPANVCSGTPFTYTPTSVQSPDVTFTWTRNAVLGIDNLAAINQNGGINEVLTNSTTAPIDVTYGYVLNNIVTNCTSIQNLTVTVNPIPVIPSPVTENICNNSGFLVLPTAAPQGTTFTWSLPTIPVTGSITGPIAAQPVQQPYISGGPFTNTLPVSSVITYTVTPYLNGCQGSDFTLNVNVGTVDPNAINLVLTNELPVCSGSAFYTELSSSAPMPQVFTWERVYTAGITNAATPVNTSNVINEVLYNSTTNPVSARYIIRVTSGSPGCTIAFTKNIVVNPAIQITSTLNPTPVCSNTTFTYPLATNIPYVEAPWARPAMVNINGNAAGIGDVAISPLSEVLVNSSTAPITVTYNISVKTAAGCQSSAPVSLVVNPAPVLNNTASAPAALCSGSSFSYMPTSSTANTFFTWSRASVAAILNPPSSGANNPNELLVNTTLNPATVSYEFTLIANGCQNIQTVNTVVNPIPVVTGQTAVICANTAFTVTPGSVPAGTQYTWGMPTSSPGAAVTGFSASASPQSNISQILNNTTLDPARAYYSVTPTANSCSGLPFTVEVTVNPRPNVAPINTALCSGTPLVYAPSPVQTGTTYSWSAPTLGPGLTAGLSKSAQTNINDLLTNSSTSSASAVYTVTPVANSCTGNIFTVTVQVNPLPVVGNLTTAHCSGTSFTPTLPAVPAGTSYTWPLPVSVPGGTIVGATGQFGAVTTISQQLTSNTTDPVQTTYTISPVSGTCAGNPFTLTVTTNPKTELSSSLTATVCSNTVFNYTGSSNTPSTNSYTWTRSAVSGISNAIGSANSNVISETLMNTTANPINVTYVYSLNTTGNCPNTQNVVVTVNPQPKLNSLLSPAVCSGTTFNYTATTLTTGTSITWARNLVAGITNGASTGGNAISELLVSSELTAVTVPYNFTLSANGCTNNEIVSLIVNPLPSVGALTTAACTNTSFSITPANVPTNTVYTWGLPTSNPVSVVTGGTTGTDVAGTISGTLQNATLTDATATYSIIPKSGTCAGNPFSLAVTVKPVAVVTSPVPLSAVCSGDVISYTPAGVPAGTRYSWGNPSFPSGQTLTGFQAQSLVTSFSQTLSSSNNIQNNATYTVTPNSNGCAGDPFTVVVPVNPRPVVSNTVSTICSGNTFTAAIGTVPAGTTYNWGIPSDIPVSSITGGSASPAGATSISQQLFNNTYAAAQLVYTVTPVTGACSGGQFTVTVNVNPATQLSSAVTAATCSNNLFNYTPASNTSGTSYTWTRAFVSGITNAAGAGSNGISETLINSTSAPIAVQYTYILNTGANCGRTETVTVTVNPTPKLSSLTTPAAICSGNTFNYTPASATAGATFQWARNPIVGISNPAQTGTGNPAEILVNISNNIIPVNYSYQVSANGCSNTELVTVNVNPLPSVANGTLAICSNTAFTYAPGSVPLNTTYSWTVPASNPAGIVTGSAGGGAQVSQTLANTSNSPATATYTVIPEANGCAGQAFTLAVTVNPIPSANDAILPPVCSGTPVNYTPAGIVAGTTYAWGNPLINPAGTLTGGIAQSGVSTFSQTLTGNNTSINTAVYTVVPTANNCSGTAFKITVPVKPVPIVSAQVATICSNNTFSIVPAGVPANTTYSWATPASFPFGAITNGTASAPGAQLISQQLINSTYNAARAEYTVTPQADGCAGTPFNITVNVNPGTQLNLSVTPPAICSKTVFSYAAASNTAGTSFNWTRAQVNGISNAPSAGTNSPDETLINITNQPIAVTYVYSLRTASNCTNTQTVTVMVNPTPELVSATVAPAVCSGTTFSYTPLSNVSGTSFTWTRGFTTFISNNPSSGMGDPAEQLFNTTTGTVSVNYQYTLTANNCSNVQTVTVPVSPTPTVTNRNVTTCSNTPFSITPGNVPGNTQYTWNMPVYNPGGSLSGGFAQNSGQQSIGQTLVNQTLNPAQARYTVVPSAGACTGAAFTVDVLVNPVATVSPQVLPAACSGSTFTYAPANVPAGTTYTWSYPQIMPVNSLTGATAESVNQSLISQTLSSSNNITNTAVYTVVPSSFGCAGNSFTLAVTVNPAPVIANIRDTICTGSSFAIAPSPVPANTTYTWGTPVHFPFGSIIGANAQGAPVTNISQTLINTTTASAQAIYTVTPVAGTCAGNPFTISVTVGANLPAIANQAVTICSGSTFNATPVNAPPGTTFSWNAPSPAPAGSATGMSAAILQTAVSQTLNNLTANNSIVAYTVQARNTGCVSNSFTATVTVLPVPKVTVTGNAVICRYPTDTVSLQFVGQGPYSFTYIDNNVPHTISGITTSPYRLVIPAGAVGQRTIAFTDATHYACSNTKDTSYFTQVINPLPVGTINSLHGTYICNNIADTLFITSPDSLGYQWRRNGTALAGATDDTLVTADAGRYNALLTNRYGCMDTVAVPMTLIKVSQPILKLSYDTYCINTQMNFRNLTDTNTTGTITWTWNFGDGNVRNGYNSFNTYTTGGDHHIRLTALQQFCPATPTSMDTTVNIQFPIPGLTMQSVSAYKGIPTPVAVRSIPDYRYRWTPSWGIHQPDSASTTFNYQQTQQYVINLISPAGCITRDSLLVRVFDNPMIDILVPKSFTPNGDGVNDILYPYVAGIREFHYFKVYNRLNQLMFETKNYDQGWNGTANGSPQPMGIYIWVAAGVDRDGKPIQKSGQTLLLR
ncbi:PKD-like domain-containing protein [Sediminibacterium ginsengisoli]|uniref:Gliding motility-associated C-terminal domain-containing protein n=1 Tax=Sediminibacterium ginsengisoli TaxID=413434 RepID=A0A1T4RBV9_9BACT|nr:PKD-like domain-containing protein [Sediminibacterium ginsengisoli]SKA13409.1 gliding motility-associated C-terminal domain-containing protein [Sediminibacterium ginsengisoli]